MLNPHYGIKKRNQSLCPKKQSRYYGCQENAHKKDSISVLNFTILTSIVFNAKVKAGGKVFSSRGHCSKQCCGFFNKTASTSAARATACPLAQYTNRHLCHFVRPPALSFCALSKAPKRRWPRLQCLRYPAASPRLWQGSRREYPDLSIPPKLRHGK